jgi:transposase
MRGEASKQQSMLVLRSAEDLVPKDHPLRRVKTLADKALKGLSPLFDEMYADGGRDSVPPERLLKASVLMALYSVRSERLFCEQLGYNLLFRWFLDMDMVEEPFDHSTFSKNRARLMQHDVAKLFFGQVVEQAQQARLMSSEHFSVDGTLIDAWASLKSFQPKDAAAERKARNRKKAERRGRGGKGPKNGCGGRNAEVNFHGQKRSNETHESTTDPEARLARKGHDREARLSYAGHALMENRSGLLVDLRISEANGTAERDNALFMLTEELPRSSPVTVGADKGYDTAEFVDQCRLYGVVPHVAQNTTKRRSAIDARTTRHAGYAISQRFRKRIEEIFGWMKTVGNFRRTRYKGRARTQLAAYLVGTAYNLIRMAKLLPEPA